MREPKIIVVGGGLAGLMATIRVAESGVPVELFSIVPVKRSHSVCAQGGINAAKNLKGEGDSTWMHFDDTIYGGDFLANQPIVKGMCEAAPAIIDLLDRMGVMFNRTPEGLLDFRRFGGTLYHRTAFAGATTGQQLLYALDEQVRRFESEDKVTEIRGLDVSVRCARRTSHLPRHLRHGFEDHGSSHISRRRGDFLHGRHRRDFPSERQTQSSARDPRNPRFFSRAPHYANGEFIQVHPTAIPGEDKCRLMSESLRGEGGRVWVPRKAGDTRPARSIPEKERFYFLEEWYPKYGNLVPRDVATRAIYKIVFEEKLSLARNERGLSRPHAYPARNARPQTRRSPRNLPEIRRPGSARGADESFSRDALHHGRPVDR